MVENDDATVTPPIARDDAAEGEVTQAALNDDVASKFVDIVVGP